MIASIVGRVMKRRPPIFTLSSSPRATSSYAVERPMPNSSAASPTVYTGRFAFRIGFSLQPPPGTSRPRERDKKGWPIRKKRRVEPAKRDGERLRRSAARGISSGTDLQPLAYENEQA